MKLRYKILIGVLVFILLSLGALWGLSYKEKPQEITYGMSFNTLYAKELGLDWKETYNAILNDLEVRHLRLAAHWPMVEPEEGRYDFSELDYQIDQAERHDAEVILAIGKRLPRWPECHIPEWAEKKTWKQQKQEIRDMIEAVVNRYKDREIITHWQVENEPYLEVFAREHCRELDEEFLKEEVALVKSLDPSRPIILTDSGNLGRWAGPYKHGDVFGTSVYVYFWNPNLGQFRTILPPAFYRIKDNLMALLYGEKETMLVELAAEPWLVEPITEVDIETQFTRMNPDKFSEIINYAKATHLEKQYLWGAEWWYWLKQKGHPEMWNRGKELFTDS